MSPQELHPGSDIDAMCSRCKALSGHTIVAMVGNAVVKVKCNTCGSEHKYKALVKERKAPAVTRVRTIAAPGAPKVKKPISRDPFEDSDELVAEYKPRVRPAKAPVAGRPKPAGKKAPDPAQVYAETLEGKEGNPVRTYRATDTYAMDELVQHPTFGLGVVVGVRDGGKVDIVFPAGTRTLVHARG